MHTEIVLLCEKGALMICHVMGIRAWQKFFSLHLRISKLAPHPFMIIERLQRLARSFVAFYNSVTAFVYRAGILEMVCRC